MATNEVKHPEEKTPVTSTSRYSGGTENFWIKNQKNIIYALSVVILAVAGYFLYQTYFQAPKERKAAEAMWKAEEYFRMDSSRLALNGDGANQGFLKIISNHGGTKAGNLAKFYAGASYLKIGDYNNAIKYLKDFSTDDKLISVRATGLLGDAYAESGKKSEAITNYRKAGTMFPDDTQNSPEYLFRAGLLLQDAGKNQEAIEVFKIIRNKYASTQRGLEIDKYLARLGSVD
ncbi:MAG: tetratricopeptide repeat protein [Chitinophagaceae bacterium]|nr:tetratricopeptide repeat protein [Chitinophagaceae bacterium]